MIGLFTCDIVEDGTDEGVVGMFCLRRGQEEGVGEVAKFGSRETT